MHRRSVSSIISFIISAVLFCSLTSLAFAQHKVHINGFNIDVKGQAPMIPKDLEPEDEQGGDALRGRLRPEDDVRLKKWIVQFNGPIHPADKQQLAAAGCRIGDYLPEYAFIVSMDGNTKANIEKLPFVSGVVRLKPAYKIRKALKDDSGAVKVRKGEKIKLLIKIDTKENQPRVLAKVQEKLGGVLAVNGDVLRIEINQEEIAEFSRLEEVLSIEEAGELKLFNDTSKWTIQGYVQNSTPIWDKGLHGEGQIVGIGDTGLDFDMPWFRDPAGKPLGPEHRKVVAYDNSLIGGPIYGDNRDWAGHGTHVAGIIAGDQSQFGGLTTANGMAPKAKLFITDFSPTDERLGAIQQIYPPPNLATLFAPAYAAGARLHNNSWGGIGSNYNAMTRSADEYMWANKDFLAIFANGNEGPGDYTVGYPADAKNVVSVGASFNGLQAEDLAYFSSNGPTADGRIKPTVTAPGWYIVSAESDGYLNTNNSSTIAMSGTSMAAPTVSGAAALIRQYYMDGYYPGGAANAANAFTPSAALVKATLVNSAQNMTGFTSYYNIPIPPIPSSAQGWGRINLANSLTFTGGTGTLDVRDNTVGLETGQSQTEAYFVDGNQPLKAALVWTDYPGAVGANPAIVNDLDLTVTTPDGTTTYRGNAFSNGKSTAGGSADRLNVEELVLLDTPAAGAYTITVSAHNVPYGPQPYALVTTGASGVTSKGFIRLDKHHYAAPGSVQIYLADRDLNTDSGAVETAQLNIMSSSEPAGEVVTLVESGPNSAVFIGTIPLRLGTAAPADGYLDVMGGDTITATYSDAGTTVTAAAVIDIIPPAISGIAVSATSDTSARISWTTDEPGTSGINYGESPALGASSGLPALTTTHTVQLAGLRENQTYYFEILSTDEAGNPGRDNNGGTYYTFTTAKLPPVFTVSSSTGAESCLDTIVISGTATDPSGVKSVTIIPPSGTAQACTLRTSDGYYECTVALGSGSNSFTVTATDMLDTAATQAISVTRLSLPDLVGTDMTVNATNFVTGQAATITFKIKNQGQCPATGSPAAGHYVMTSPYLSTDDVINTADRIICNSYNYQGLAAGAESPASCQYTIPVLTSGIYYFGMLLDRSNYVAEENETNNAFVGPKVYIGTDTTPPTGAILIDNGAIATGTPVVTLTLSATDSESGVTQMQFSNDSENGPWSEAEAYAATKSWTLSAGDGSKRVFVKFRDLVGNWSTAYPSNTITYYSAPGIDVIALSGGIVNRTYQAALHANGGLAPFTWSVVAGNLPPGITLNGSGELSGTPTTAGSSSVTFRATDSLNRTADKILELSVSDVEQQWLRTSTVNYSIGRAVVFDDDGNAFVAGTGRGDGVNDDILVEKVSPDGATIWSSFLNRGPASAIGMARSDSNSVVVLGSKIDTLTGATGYQLIKYGTDGAILWTTPLDGSATYTALSIDGTGSINVAGYLNNGTADQVLVRKLDSAGTPVWTYTGNSSSAQRVNKITSDASGNVYVAATATGTSGGDLLTMKLNAAGGFVWQETFHDADDTSSGIAVDATGNVYVTGRSLTTVNKVVTVKYGATGGQQWSRAYERLVYSDRPESMVLGSDGNLYVVGRTYYLDPGNSDSLILKYNTNGDILWSKGVEALPGNIDYAYAIAVDAKDNLVISGFTAAGNVHYLTTQKFRRTDLSVVDAPLAAGVVGSAYSADLGAIHGTEPYVWSMVDSLPSGLLLSSTGIISGTPEMAGNFPFTVKVTDGSGTVATRPMALELYAPLAVTTTALPDGTTAAVYSQTLAASGGKSPYRWSVVSGSLPSGLTLTPSSGIISGTPTTAGTSSVTVQVTDANGTTATKPLSLTIVTVGVTPLNAWANLYSAAPNNTSASNLNVGSFTVGSDANRLLLIAVVMEIGTAANPTISAKYGGTSLTQVRITNNSQREIVWVGYLKEAQLGSGSKPLTISYSGASGNATALHVKWAAFSNVNQTAPVADSAENNTNTTSATFGSTIDYVTNGITTVVAANGGSAASGSLNATPAFTAGSATADNQTSRAFTTAMHPVGGSYSSSTAVSWSGTTSSRSALVAVSLQP